MPSALHAQSAQGGSEGADVADKPEQVHQVRRLRLQVRLSCDTLYRAGKQLEEREVLHRDGLLLGLQRLFASLPVEGDRGA